MIIMNYEEMLLYVKECLEKAGAIQSTKFSFRNRFEHIKRVYKWCIRLIEDIPNCNQEILFTAAIFHDVGYAKQQENHAQESKRIFIEYAQEHAFPSQFILATAELIERHSDKHLLKTQKAPNELTLLLEADLLDEEGALGITWDLMGEGAKSPKSFENGLQALWSHSAHILDQDYMVTPLARKYWEKKQEFVKRFIDELSSDLFIK